MKLLVVSTWRPFPPDNGSRLRAFHLLSELSAHHEITVLTFADGAAPDMVRGGMRAVASRVEIVPGTAFADGPPSIRGTLSLTPRLLVQSASRRMQHLVAELAPAHDVAMGFQVNAAMYLRSCDRPKVFEEAEVGVMLSRRCEAVGLQRLRREATWQKTARFTRRLISEFERTTVVSPVERQHMVDFGADRTRLTVVPNAADERDLERLRPVSLPRVVYPGSLTYAANLDAVRSFLQTTWPAVLRNHPQLEFVVTGSHDGVDLTQLPNTERVTFSGRVDDVKAFVSESAVVIVPLRMGGGTRLKILEALSLGTPVVSTSKGAEGLDVTPEQDILIGDEPVSFGRQVLRVVKDPSLASRLSANGRALVRRAYTWRRSAEVLNDTLEHAVRSWRERSQ